MDVMNIRVWIQNIAYSAIQQAMEPPATLVIQMAVTNTAAMGSIAFIAARQVRVLPVIPVIRMGATKDNLANKLGYAASAAPVSAAYQRVNRLPIQPQAIDRYR